MKYVFFTTLILIGGFLNAQENLNYIEITIHNLDGYYNLSIEKNSKESSYNVKSKITKFSRSKKIVVSDSVVINNEKASQLLDIVLDIDNKAFKRNLTPCLDGKTIRLDFSDNLNYNMITQMYQCVNSTDEVYLSIVKIYNLFPFKEKIQ